ncbi:MAG TPA: RHS repeat-associated core domain-containing protein [Verrucomicrobiae bacterium]|nr:RHS repeat-associated core domain-containing protein [Verrucomicrobiae bacterium]
MNANTTEIYRSIFVSNPSSGAATVSRPVPFSRCFCTTLALLVGFPSLAPAVSVEGQIESKRAFAYPIQWIGQAAPPNTESAALLSALSVFDKEGPLLGNAALEIFLTDHPYSAWDPSLNTGMAEYYRRTGAYSRALNHWENAWNETKTNSTTNAQALAVRVFAGWTRLLASLGRTDELAQLFKEFDTLNPAQGPFGTTIEETREALVMMRARPGDSYRCGSFALANLAKAMGLNPSVTRPLFRAESPDAGFNVSALLALAQTNGIPLKAVRRPPGAALIVPSIVHWRLNHYAAILEKKGNRYRIMDATFGGQTWITGDVIDHEASGVYLVPSNQAPAQWATLTPAECARIYGKGVPNVINDWDDDGPPDPCGDNGDDPSPCDPPSANDGPGGDSNTNAPCCSGMPQWSVSSPYTTVWLTDVPLLYRTSSGRWNKLVLQYKHRGESKTNLMGSFGDKWECNWLSVMETSDDGQYGTNHLAGGGISILHLLQEIAEYKSAQLFAIHDAKYADGYDPTGARLRYDAMLFTNAYVMLQKLDKFGRSMTFNYDTNHTVPLLTNVVDLDGRGSTLSYTNPAFPTLITSVTDPYNQSAYFIYDNLGRLTNVVDAIGMKSSFQYDTSDRMASMTTPYGTTSFSYLDGVSTNYVYDNKPTLRRAVLVTESSGDHQLFEYCDDGPAGPTAGDYGYTTFRNSYHWNREQYLAIPSGDLANLIDMPGADYSLASIKHWLHGQADGTSLTVSDTLSDEAPPVDANGYRPATSYYYYGQTGTGDPFIGTLKRVVEVDTPLTANAIDIGRNTIGRPTNTVYANVGTISTTASYTNIFDPSGMYLQQVWGPRGELVRGYGYDPVITNLLTSVTNALGQVLRYAYNTSTLKVTGITFPSGLARTNIYYSSGASQGFLQAQIDPGIRTNSFGYQNGNIIAQTNELGLVTAYTWDNLNRLTSVAYPDGTTTSNVYNNLDIVAVKDRLNQWTRYGYNTLRQLVAVTNVNGQVTQYGYCECGAPNLITRWNGSTPLYTTLTYDLGGRLTNAIYPDGYQLNYAYDVYGNLSTLTNTDGYGLFLGYEQLGLNLQTAYANILSANSETLQLLYRQFDEYGRITNSIDRNGVMTYTAFDYLDRPVNRQFVGSALNHLSGLETFVYAAQGLTNYTDPLGHLTTFVRDVASRVLYETNAQNQALQFVYNPADELLSLTDGKSQTTTWAYDAYGRVTNKVDAAAITDFVYSYDANDRLLTRASAAKGTTTYQYDPLGNLTNVLYPVSGTNSYVYDGLNRLVSMHDGIGTSTFTWTLASQLASQSGPFPDDAISYGYTDRRRSGLNLIQPNSSPWVQTYDYDGFGRLMTIGSPAGSFGYQYASFSPDVGDGNQCASDLIQQLNYPSGAYSYRQYDDLAELFDSTLYGPAGGKLDEHSYLYNQGFQRTNQTFQAGNVMNYLYDNIGQLTNATGLESDLATRRLQEQFGYAYDKAWNLSSRTKNGLTETFSANSVNELSTISRSGTLTVAGTTTSPATGVNVSGTGISGSQVAAIYADSTWALTNVTPANGQNTWNASATDANSRSSQASVTVNFPASASFSYDANGNLLSDGTRSFAYDDENELTSVWVTNGWRSDFLYDGMMRRRLRREYTWSSGAWLQTNEVHYVCDGLLVVQERWFDPQLSTSTPRQAVTYTRGNDLGGDLQRAGGIGGLLARTDSALLLGGSPSGHAYYHFDGNGNVTCLISMSNSIVALYQYDPFGNTLSKSGSLADANLYRFSSKEWQANAAFSYYGYRFYDPSLQRWVNRDPIGELGGWNVYGFLLNNPMNQIDLFGLCGGGADDADPESDLEREETGPAFGEGQKNETELEREMNDALARAAGAMRQAQDAAAAAAAEAKAVAEAAEAAAQAAAAVRTPESFGSNENTPPLIIYRAGNPSPNNFKATGDPPTVSFRASLSNPYPTPFGQRPVFRLGEPYFGLDTSKLPEGTAVIFDNNPPGHVGVSPQPPEAFQRAVIPETRGKCPK